LEPQHRQQCAISAQKPAATCVEVWAHGADVETPQRFPAEIAGMAKKASLDGLSHPIERPVMQHPHPQLMTKVAVCERLCVSDRTLEKLVRARQFPEPLRLGKHVLWAQQAVERWLEQKLAPQLNWTPPASRGRSKTVS